MGQLIHLSGPEGPSRPQPNPKKSAKDEGLAGVQFTPPIIAAICLAVIILAGIVFMVTSASTINSAASTPMMDTGTVTTAPGYAEKHANGMDTSTESPNPPAANNGMDTSTGR